MTDSVLEILIKLGLEGGENGEKARAALESTKTEMIELKRQAVALGVSSGDLDEKISDVNRALSKLANTGMRDAAEGAEHLHINHRALHQIMHMIGHETAPELGRALSGAMYGWIGAAVAAGAALEFIHRKLEEVAEKARKLREEESAINTDAWTAQVEAINAASQAADGFAERLAKAKENLNGLKDAESAEMGAVKERNRLEIDGIKSKEKDELDKLHERKRQEEEVRKAGKITTGEGEFQDFYRKSEEEIRSRYAQQEQTAKVNGQLEQIEREKFEADSRKAKQDELDKAAVKAQSDVDFATRDPDAARNQKELDAAKTKQTELDKARDKQLEKFSGQYGVDPTDLLQKNLKKQQDFIAQNEGKPNQLQNVEGAKIIAAALVEQLKQIKEINRPSEENKQFIEDTNNLIAEHTSGLKRAKDALDKAERVRDENSKAIEDHTKALREHAAFLRLQIRSMEENSPYDGVGLKDVSKRLDEDGL